MNNNKMLAIALGLSCIGSACAASPVQGTWQLQNAEAAPAALTKAIDSVVKEMNFFVRSIARSRLEEQAVTCLQWTLADVAQGFQWQCDDKAPMVVAYEGETALKGDDGRDIKGSFSQSGQSVTTSLSSERGLRTNQWQLGADGNSLTYTATLTSEKLPKPFTWTFNYKKVP